MSTPQPEVRRPHLRTCSPGLFQKSGVKRAVRLQRTEAFEAISRMPLFRIYRFRSIRPLPPKIGHLDDVEMVVNVE